MDSYEWCTSPVKVVCRPHGFRNARKLALTGTPCPRPLDPTCVQYSLPFPRLYPTVFFQVDTDLESSFDSTSLPLSSPFLGETGAVTAYATGGDTGNYTVSYTPFVRGEYAITVQKPAVWEVQLVQTVSEETGEDLSGAKCRDLLFAIYFEFLC